MNVKESKLDLGLETYIHSISRLSESLSEMIIYSPRLIKTIDIGEFIKFQNYYKDGFYLTEPLALTPVYLNYRENLIHFIINEVGASSMIMRNLKVGEKIVAMGAVGAKFDLNVFINKKVLFICEGFAHYLHLFFLSHIFDKKIAKNITLFSNDLSSIIEFYRNEIISHVDEIIDFEGDMNFMNNSISNNFENFDYVVIGIKNKDVIEKINKSNVQVVTLINAPLQCMMKGVCARCMQHGPDGKYFFNCAQSRYRAHNGDFDYNHARLNQNSLMEKINYMKLKSLFSEKK